MAFRFSSVFFASVILCSACGGEAANSQETGPAAGEAGTESVSIKRKTGSFLDDYRAARSGAAPKKPLQVSGDWKGVLFCPSGAYPLSVDLEQSVRTVSGVASIDHALADERKPTPFYVEHKDRRGEGEYEPETQLFSLRTARDETENPQRARGLYLDFMLAPGDGDRALVNAFETTAGGAERQCAGVAAKGKAAQKIENFKTAATAIREDRRAVISGESCPAKYRKWVDAVIEGAAPFDDAVFKPAFGASFRDMEAEALLSASALISGSCAETEDRARNIKILRIGADLRNYKSYDAENQTFLRNAVFDDWAGWVDAEMKRGVNFGYSQAVALRAAPNRLGLRGDPKAAAFDAKIAPVVEAAESSRDNDEIAERIERNKDDFRTLVNMQLEAQSRGDVDMEMVAAGLDYYLADAAKVFAAVAEDAGEAIYMNAWVHQLEAGGDCPAASRRSCNDAASVFKKKTNDLAAQFAKAESDAFRALEKDARGTEGLAQIVTFERRLTRDYAGLTELPAFAKTRSQRDKARQALQRKHAGDIRKEIESVNTAPAIRAIEDKYFIEGDLDAGPVRQVAAAIDKGLAGTRPFKDIPGAVYFNALYNQDFEALRALDRDYVAGIRPLMTFGAQQVIQMGPLIDALAGQRPGTTAQDMAHGLQNMSALYAVMGTYLVNYDRAYEKCLKPGARTVEISQRTDMVTRDGFGNEIRRVEGWTDRDYYRINPEFSGHFNTLFDTATGSAQQQMLDLFLNDAQITFLRQGAERLMSNYDCASPEVKQLEAGFLAYDRELKKRR